MSKRIAIFLHGGISGGTGSQGFPGIVALTSLLASRFGITVYSLAPAESSPGTTFRICSPPAWITIRPLRWFYLILTFIADHLSKKYDRVFSFWGYPMGFVVTLLGKLLRIRSLVYLLGGETANVPEIRYGHLRKPLSKMIVVWTCKNVSSLVVLTRRQAQTLRSLGVKRKIHVIPLGVDKNLFFPMVKHPGLPLKLIHVANLTEVKDQRTLIWTFDALRKKLPAKLRIVGPDFLKGEIQKLVRSMQLEQDVSFIGPLLQKEIVEHYHWADLCIITSLSEGQNNSLTEAMMCGILPVSTNVGVMDEEFGKTVGIVAACKDYESLAGQIADLFQHPDLWKERTVRALGWASRFDLAWTSEQLESLIRDEQ